MKPAQTSEEAKWMASVLDPEKAKRRLKYVYIVLAVWIVVSVGWLVVVIGSLIEGKRFPISDGFTCVAFILGYINTIMAVVNTRRVAVGKHPLNL